MVFASLIFMILLSITIWLASYNANPFTLGVSAIWEMISGSCGLRCRQNRNTVKDQTDQDSINSREQITFIEARLAIEEANRQNQAQETVEQTDGMSHDLAIVMAPRTTRQETPVRMTNVGTVDCKCGSCPCKVIEDAISNIKPVEHAYRDLAEEIRKSYFFLMLQDFCNQLMQSYPAAIEHLEDYDKIDSQENFYFLSSNEPNQRRTLSRYVDVKIRSSPVKLIPSVGPSTPDESKPPSPPNTSKNESNKSTTPASPSESTSKTKKRWFRKEENPADLREVPSNSKATSTSKTASKTKPELPKPRNPQSEESLEKDIKEFIRTGPTERAPLYTCPGCKSKGLTCIRGCPNESRDENKEKKD